jgi:hypothetical protein
MHMTSRDRRSADHAERGLVTTTPDDEAVASTLTVADPLRVAVRTAVTRAGFLFAAGDLAEARSDAFIPSLVQAIHA